MKKTLLASVAIAALTTIGGAGPARAVVLEFSAVSAAAAGFDASAGWSFATTEKISVTALDAFDPTGDGAAGTVRLYTAGGTVLASARVTTKDPKEGSPIMAGSNPSTHSHSQITSIRSTSSSARCG